MWAYQKAGVIALERPDAREVKMAQILSTLNITDLMIRQGQFENAHQVLKTAWTGERFPGYAVNLSIFYIQEGSFDKAAAFLTEAISRQEDYKWFSAHGRLYLNREEAYRLMGDCDRAKADFAEAQTDPDTRGLKIPDCIERKN